MSEVAWHRAASSVRRHFRLFGFRGIARRALMKLPGGGALFYAQVPAHSHAVVLRLGTTDVAAFEHVFVNDEYGFKLKTEPYTIVDLGANVGLAAAYFCSRYPKARVIAVEPDPENFLILKKNAEMFSRISPVNAALWNRNGTVSLEQSGHGSWGIRVGNKADHTSNVVRAVTFTTLLKEFNIDQVDLLKVDIEGAECELFEDAGSWIDRVQMMCVELHDRFRPGCSAAFAAATRGFPVQWRRGELCCVAREGAALLQ